MEFTSQQSEVIRVLSDGVLPADDVSPSASQLGVNFIFADIARSWTDEVFNETAEALDTIHELSESLFGQNISALSQDDVLVLIELIAEAEEFFEFWNQFRLLITLVYYALPPAYLSLGMPGPTVDQGGLTVDGFPV